MAHYDKYKTRRVSRKGKTLYHIAMFTDRHGVWKELPGYYITSAIARAAARGAHEKEAQEAGK